MDVWKSVYPLRRNQHSAYSAYTTSYTHAHGPNTIISFPRSLSKNQIAPSGIPTTTTTALARIVTSARMMIIDRILHRYLPIARESRWENNVSHPPLAQRRWTLNHVQSTVVSRGRSSWHVSAYSRVDRVEAMCRRTKLSAQRDYIDIREADRTMHVCKHKTCTIWSRAVRVPTIFSPPISLCSVYLFKHARSISEFHSALYME